MAVDVTDEQTTRIEVSDVSGMSVVRSILRTSFASDSHVSDSHVDPDRFAGFLVAVTEILTNALDAHERADVDEPVVVEIDRDRRTVSVVDSGGGFDPDDARPLPDAAIPRGRGLHLARALCPAIAWQRTGVGMNCLLPFDTEL